MVQAQIFQEKFYHLPLTEDLPLNSKMPIGPVMLYYFWCCSLAFFGLIFFLKYYKTIWKVSKYPYNIQTMRFEKYGKYVLFLPFPLLFSGTVRWHCHLTITSRTFCFITSNISFISWDLLALSLKLMSNRKSCLAIPDFKTH